MIQNEKIHEIFIASTVQNISNILILNLDNYNIISRLFYPNYLDFSVIISRFLS